MALTVLALLLSLVLSANGGGPPQLHVDRSSGTCSDDRTATAAASPATPLCSIPRALDLASAGDTIVVHGSDYPQLKVDGYHRDATVTVLAAPGAPVTLDGVELSRSDHLRIQGFRVTSRFDVLQSGDHLQIVGNDIGNQRSGLYLYGWVDPAGLVSDVLIAGNTIHDIDYTGEQGVAEGYGITMAGNVARIEITHNTIRSVGEDYIQGGGSFITVTGNTFLGPSLAGSHPDAHADLWQVFGTSDHLTFTDNVVRHTGTSSGLLLQFSSAAQPHRDVLIANNLFDHGSDGYEMQLYNTTGLRVIGNTILNDSYGIVFRRDDRVPDGSGYVIANNIVRAAAGHRAISYEALWGTEDFNWIVTPGSGPSRWGRHDIVGGMPRFADAAAGDFHLVTGSRGTGAGDSAVGMPTDLAGRSRGDGPDLGAYQSSPAGPALDAIGLTSSSVRGYAGAAAALRVSIEPQAGRSRSLTTQVRDRGMWSAPLGRRLAPGTYVVTVRATARRGGRSQAIRTVRIP
ncbi:right-handed parallel beta-helix repeat-containing protein [Capillimicrobium parvum]|uniref:Right handed beta helix domain-containing protein n=1 Tax=Capillimicrobium parvum TaxID=2884022 RepID=A0A9E7C2S3_9ACTN|nr:right-handed parallel beta-helix repeat-containing protein [Capillimicrobium parvum]UGS37753.1 hypothetical protein DSM104329_04174 [Capillimicrobium parvum]